VVVTHHERPEYLRAAVDGFAAQVVPPREVVVVDDGSVSHSARDALDALEAQPWPWPLRVVRAAHGGVHAARNIGFREAASDYVLFFDDDDIPFPDLVGTLAGAQAASGADVVAAGARLFRGRASPVPRAGDAVAIKLGQPYELGLLSNHYGGPVCLWPSALLEDLGGFRDGRVVHEDWELLARASARGARVTAVPDALYWYRQAEGSLVNTNTAAKRRATIAEVAAIVEGSLPTTASLLPYLAAGAYERLEQTKRQHPISAAVGRARRVAASRLARPRRRRRGQGS